MKNHVICYKDIEGLEVRKEIAGTSGGGQVKKSLTMVVDIGLPTIKYEVRVGNYPKRIWLSLRDAIQNYNNFT